MYFAGFDLFFVIFGVVLVRITTFFLYLHGITFLAAIIYSYDPCISEHMECMCFTVVVYRPLKIDEVEMKKVKTLRYLVSGFNWNNNLEEEMRERINWPTDVFVCCVNYSPRRPSPGTLN